MLVHVEIPGMSLNLQDPLLRLTGIHPRQTGSPLFCQILTDFARGRASGQFYPGSRTGGNNMRTEQSNNELETLALNDTRFRDQVFSFLRTLDEHYVLKL